MSESEHHEAVVVGDEGLQVTKRFEDDEFPVPAIVFEFTSARAEDVTVLLSDTVPEGVAVEDLGFHPEYGSEYWTIEEGEITFERTIPAESSYTTVYGIRAAGSDDIDQFLTEPTLESVDPPVPEGESVSVDDVPAEGAAVEDALDTGPEIPDGDVEPAPAAADGPVESLELGESRPADAAETATEASGTAEDVPAAADAGQGEESLVAALAAELRAGEASEAAVAQVRETLQADTGRDGDASAGGRAGETDADSTDGEAPDPVAGDRAPEASGSVAARLDQLRDDVNELRSMQARLDRIQRDVADLRAYTGALEEFLDDNGTGADLIEDFEDRLDELEARLDSAADTEADTNGEPGESSGADVDSDADADPADTSEESSDMPTGPSEEP